MRFRGQKYLVLFFIISLLFFGVLTGIAENETSNSTDDGYSNNQSKMGQQGNNSHGNSNQPFLQGVSAWIVVIIIVIVLIVVMYVLLTRYMKVQMKKNTELIQNMMNQGSLDSENNLKKTSVSHSSLDDSELQRTVLKFLSYNENRVMKKLIEHEGSVLQSEISRMPNMGKVKAHRVLQDLETKEIIKKEPYGKTNRVLLDETIKKLFLSSQSE